jgi:hypothetical protein
MQSERLLGWVPVDGGEMNGGSTALVIVLSTVKGGPGYGGGSGGRMLCWKELVRGYLASCL